MKLYDQYREKHKAMTKTEHTEHKEFFIKENDFEVIVGFPYNEQLIKKCKEIYPYKWDKTTKTWRYPALIREQVYSVFGLPCPPKHNKGHFILESTPSEFLMSHQKKCLELATIYPKYGIYSSTGTGKCHGKGTEIIMYDGTIKKVEDIRIGDLLMGDDSTPRKVLDIGCGVDMMYKVTPLNGKPFICNKSHILSLKGTNTNRNKCSIRKYINKKGEEKTYLAKLSKHKFSNKIIDIPIDEYLKLTNHDKHILKLYKVQVNFEEKKLDLDPYLLGLWLGNGHSNVFSITSSDNEIVNYLFMYAENNGYEIRKQSMMNNKSSVYHLVHHKTNNLFKELQEGYSGKINPLHDKLKDYHLIYNKHIPHVYKVNSEENRLKLLAGLIDSDGHLSANATYEITLKVKQLAEDIVFLSRSLGFKVSIRECVKTIKETGFSGIYYRIFISGDIDKVPVLLDRKKSMVRKQIKDSLVTGFKIEEIGMGEYFGFTLDNNGRYLLEDFTVTHNTIIALEILRHKQSKALIVAPLSTLETVWIDDALKFYPQFKNVIVNLYPFSKAEREILIKKHFGIHVINYNGFKIHFDALLAAEYKTLIIEESSILKGRTTLIAKKLIEFSQKIDSVYLLSGTPAPNSKQEFFPQIECIAPGLLGYSFHSYRNHYFHPLDRNGYNWVENESTRADLVERLKKVCIFIPKSVIPDLPEKTFIVKECEMSLDQLRVYKQMKNDMVAEIGEITIIKPSLLAKIMTLRQITSGFIYYQGDSLRFSDTKLKLLKETLEEIGPNQVILWAVFKEEIERLLIELPGSRAVYGENESQDEKNENIRDFKEGKFQYLIANAASLAHGQTFVNCSYTIYYSLDYSNERWLQSQDRIHRKGQVNKCTYIILLAKNSIDGIIYKALQKKEYDSKELLNHLKGE
jgi:hypothetical protein